MAPTALLTSFLYADNWDATADANALSVRASRAALDGTTFRAVINNGGWEEVGASGSGKADVAFNGFWSAATAAAQDPQSFNNLGTSNRVFTAGSAETEGAPCFMWRGVQVSYQWLGQYDTNAPFSLQAKLSDGQGGLVRGQLAAKLQSKAATGLLGSIVNLGAPTATQYVYAHLHVFSAGTTITVQVQSDDSAGFASPTTRATIGPITVAGGSYIARVAGPFVGETHWRLNVSAITGTFSVAGAIAVQ